MDPAANPQLEGDWYYSLELAPGVWTKGLENPNLALTRELLTGVELGPGHGALDIGTQEGLVPALLARRGLERVVAYDRDLKRERLELVREALGLRFELIGGIPLAELRPALVEAGHAAFDLVVLSGVIYHMADPFSGLAWTRGLARTGGLVLVETNAVFSATSAVHLDLGRYSPGGVNAPSAHGLETMLRGVGLEPIDAVALDSHEIWPGAFSTVAGLGDEAPPLGRLAVICRAVDPAEIDIGLAPRDLCEFIDAGYVGSERPPLGYTPGSDREPLEQRRGVLHEVERRPVRLDDPRLKLALGDTI